MRTTKIEWTEKTWNPITGCTKTSSGCAHCYAEVMARRLHAMGQTKYQNGFQLTLHPEDLDTPKAWKKGCTVFVCSMSDIFHPDVPFEFIDRIMETICATPQHRFQVLTKRAERMEEYFSTRPVPENVWLGVTVETPAYKSRIDCLRNVAATVRFLSCEPLLEDLGTLDLTGIQWVIVGGESGPHARPMKEEWALGLLAQTHAAHASFFFKQWGTWGQDGIKRNKHANGKLIGGRVVQEMPK